MPCEWCNADGDESNCPICRADQQHRDRQRHYSRLVSAFALSLLVAICAAAAICGAWNKLNH